MQSDKLDVFIFSDKLFAISQLYTLKICALTVDSSDLRFLSVYYKLVSSANKKKFNLSELLYISFI